MTDEETQQWERKRKAVHRWTWAGVGAVLVGAAAWFEVWPHLVAGDEWVIATLNAPARLDGIEAKQKTFSEDLAAQAWRVYRVEQALNIRDDPPKLREHYLEQATPATNTVALVPVKNDNGKE